MPLVTDVVRTELRSARFRIYDNRTGVHFPGWPEQPVAGSWLFECDPQEPNHRIHHLDGQLLVDYPNPGQAKQLRKAVCLPPHYEHRVPRRTVSIVRDKFKCDRVFSLPVSQIERDSKRQRLQDYDFEIDTDGIQTKGNEDEDMSITFKAPAGIVELRDMLTHHVYTYKPNTDHLSMSLPDSLMDNTQIKDIAVCAKAPSNYDILMTHTIMPLWKPAPQYPMMLDYSSISLEIWFRVCS